MTIQGNVFIFGDHVNTDEIIPARYLSSSSPSELARHVMEDIRPGFAERADLAGGVIVAGKNFGCGSSREHAPLAIQAAGFRAVVAASFARIFLRNAINIGLPIVELKDTAAFREGDPIEIDLAAGQVRNGSNHYSFRPYPDFLQRIISGGGWLEYARKRP